MAPKRKAPTRPLPDSPGAAKRQIKTVKDIFGALPLKSSHGGLSLASLIGEARPAHAVCRNEAKAPRHASSDGVPWIEKFAPKTKKDLAVNKSKVQVRPFAQLLA